MPTNLSENEITFPLATNDPEELLADMEEFLNAIECLQADITPMTEAEIVELQQDADYLRNKIEQSRLVNEDLVRMRAAHTRARMQYTLQMERYVTMQIQIQISDAMRAKRSRFQD